MQKLDIVMGCPGLPFDGSSKGALGGSETACKEMAEALGRRGHSVTVFSLTENPGLYNGVTYLPLDQWSNYAGSTPHDVSIVQRSPEMCSAKTNSLLNILWNHDIALKRNMDLSRSSLWNVDKIFTVSEWHRKQTIETHEIAENIIHATRNGLNFDLIDEAPDAEKRDPYKLMYSARPERGLDVMLSDILPRLLEREPKYKLCVAGYGNQSKEMAPFYEHIDKLIASFGDRVEFLGQLPKTELYAHYKSAGAYVYPTPSPIMPNFNETSCISAMECMACELPFISTRRGALPETLRAGCGVLLDEGDNYAERMVEAILNVTRGHIKLDFRGVSRDEMSWDGIAAEWEADFMTWIDERNESPDRLARHLLKYSDIQPLKHLAAKMRLEKDELAPDIQQAIESYSFTDDIEGYYNSLNKTWTDECFEQAATQPRFVQLSEFLGRLADKNTVYDFGCSYGAYTIHLANLFPEKQFVGYDFDILAITRASELAKKYARHGNVRFTNIHADPAGETFSILLLNEVLEHTERPWEVLDYAEEAAENDAVIYLTVPYGPWEFLELDKPEHLWHLSSHDLRDMLCNKKGVALNAMTYALGMGALDAPMGFWICAYQKSGAGTNPINIERHLRMQRPKQTVSVTMIAGPEAEEQLRWVLNPLVGIADEFIIVDCGLSPEAKLIFADYGAKIIVGPDPKEVGFDEARNTALPHCSMDWILWIDDDERLVDPQRVHKYLRESMYNGFGIRQHHFAIDTTFDPDKPVRLFRNRPCKGKDMLWWGVIHEHPELGLNEGPGEICVLSDVNIAHTGYLTETVRKDRFARNYPLLQKDCEKYPDRKLQKSLLMRDKILLCRDRMKSNGGTIDEPVLALAQEVLDLHKEHFLGKKVFAGDDPAGYYSQALEILGRGISAEDIKNSGIMESLQYNHETVDDLLEDVGAKLRDYIAPRENLYY